MMKQCKRCLTPETHEAITFDSEGICSVCRQAEQKRAAINWEERGRWLTQLVDQYRGKALYDCIVPYSGGKDSVFQLWYVVKKLGLTPLVVRFDHWGFRPLVAENNERVFKELGVDVLTFTPDFHIVQDLMLESLKRTGDFCWHCHTGVFGHTMQIALRYQVPLVIYGESSSEYVSYTSFDEITEADDKYFDLRINLGMNADAMYDYLGGRWEKRRLYPYAYPDPQALKDMGCRAIWLGNYIFWDTQANARLIQEELGWKGQDVEGIPPSYSYEKIECKFQGIRDYCRYIKRGYGRTAHLAAIDIRAGRMTTEEGRALIAAHDGKRPAALPYFLSTVGITEQEFYDILQKNEVAPWHFEPGDTPDGKPLHDMAAWGEAAPVAGKKP